MPSFPGPGGLLSRILAGACLIAGFSWLVAPAAAEDKPIRVLIVTGMEHPAHNWRETTPALKEELGKDARMKVDVLEDPYQLESADLARFHVVFLHFNNWQKPDPGDKAKENLRQFVAGGGGLAILHFACGAFGDWAEFPKLAGRVWDRKNTHDPREPFRVQITSKLHPVTREMESFEADDELYVCLTGDRPVELLADARSKKTGLDHPMAFTLSYGKGRVFHTPLGHDARAIHIPGTAEMIRRGVAWAAGRPVVRSKQNP
jgi:type 1 glutamine amidotransferase